MNRGTKRRRKTFGHDATDDTPLNDILGFGPSAHVRLRAAGYKTHGDMTVGQFKETVGSYESLQKKMRTSEGNSGYGLTMLRSLWCEPVQTKQPNEFMRDKVQGRKAEGREEDTREKKEASAGNHLLSPAELPGEQAEQKQEKQVPEIDALDRVPDPTKAMPIGNIVGGPKMAVIPDVTLNVSPTEKGVNGPTEVLPNTPVPLIPAAALGTNVGGLQATRLVPCQSLKEKQDNERMRLGAPRTKANGEQDMGQDGRGDIVEEAKVGQDYPLRNDEQEEEGGRRYGKGSRSMKYGDRLAALESGVQPGRKFTRKPYSQVHGTEQQPKQPSEPQQQQPGAYREEQMSHPSKHPYAQASLWANHDKAMTQSYYLEECRRHAKTRNSAAALANLIRTSDASFYKYNPATQGVQAPYVPPASSNFLQRGAMITDYQFLGANPMYNQFGPCPWDFERMSGPFR